MKEIALQSKKWSGLTTLIDDSDFELVSRFKWHPVKQKRGFYVRSDQVGYLHRLLLPNSEEVDHWDGDGLNNLRRNLRECSSSQNHANMATFKNGFIGRFRLGVY
jgi:hypothetical protein